MNDVLIIGCGKIAGFWEERKSSQPYGHANAFLNHGQFRLVGCVDRNLKAAQQFAEKYAIKKFSDNTVELLRELKPTVVSICTPDSSHFQVICEVLEENYGSLKLIFLEKPACENQTEFKRILYLADSFGVSVVVNHSRRFHPFYRWLKKKYLASGFGELIRGDAFYYGGWKHNGVHLVDTISYVFTHKFHGAKEVDRCGSRHEGDPTLSVQAKLGIHDIPFWFHGFDEEFYQLFDFDLKFSKGRLKIVNFEEEVIWYGVQINAMGERVLFQEKIDLPLVNTTPMEEAIDVIGQYMKDYDPAVLDGVLLKDIENTMNLIWNVERNKNA